MKFGMVGLGKMGGNMVRRICDESRHEVVVYDRDQAVVRQLEGVSAISTDSLETLVRKLDGNGPRVVWIMVPAGDATQRVVDSLVTLLSPGDVIIDGGNSRWSDDRERYSVLQPLGIHYVDVGTSGGVWGRENGYCMMVGGDMEAVGLISPILNTLAPPYSQEHGPGWLHVGSSGAGHFVKMVHNGIEYGMMRSIAEGFALLNASSEFDFDHAALAHLFMQGSVIRSWLVELLARTFEAEGNELAELEPVVAESGEGRWTVEEAARLRVPMPVISTALFARFESQGLGAFAGRSEAGLRAQFGGHGVVRPT